MKLFIYGSTGDLVKRKVMPALQSLNFGMEVYALGRKDLDDKSYYEWLGINSEKFKKQLHYKKINFEKKAQDYLNLLDKKETNFFYLSLPPSMQMEILESLSLIKKKGFRIQILIEKPFGSNFNEALKIKKYISNNFEEKEIYLSDHYLFKKSILKIKKTPFKSLRIVNLETLGLEGRGYYDSIGALRDMVQSHFMNILFKLTNLDLSNVKIIEFTKSQYKDYQKELAKPSRTETYVKLKFEIKDRSFEFETGKKFNKKESFIEIDNHKYPLDSDIKDYEKLFSSFFKSNGSSFPTIDNTLKSWKFIELLDKR